MIVGLNDAGNNALDAISLVFVAGVVMQVLPVVAVVLSIVWTSIRIGEWIVEKVQKRRADKDDAPDE